MTAILLVEDDPHFSSVLRELLEDNRYDVELASTAAEAIARAQKRAFHLLLTDVRIAGPDDGVTALEAIQKLQPNIRCIIMTGYADAEVPVRAARLRADDYLHKPFKLKTLLQAVTAVLAQDTPFRSLFQRVAEAPGQAKQRAVRWVFDAQLQKLNTVREHCTKEFFLLLRSNHLKERLAYQFYCNWEQLELQYLTCQTPAQWKSLTSEYEKFNTRPPTGARESSCSFEAFSQLLEKVMDGRVELVHLSRAVQLLHNPQARTQNLEAYSTYHWLWEKGQSSEDPFLGLRFGGYTLSALRSGDQSGPVRLYEARHEVNYRPGDLILCLASSPETEPLEIQELQSGKAVLLERRMGHHFLLYRGYGLTLKMSLPPEGLPPDQAWELMRPVFLQVRDQFHSQKRFSGCFCLQDIDRLPGQSPQITNFSADTYLHMHRTRQLTSFHSAPEVFDVAQPTAAADQAVLGRLLFEVILGGHYPSAEVRINLRALGSAEADSHLRPFIPRLGALARPFYLMCQTEPDKRYPSLEAAIQALDSAMATAAR